MKDISNTQQEKFILMSTDNEGNKFWRLNFNIYEVPVESSEGLSTQFECDFVPQDGGLQAEEPSVELFYDELVRFGLTEEQISKI